VVGRIDDRDCRYEYEEVVGLADVVSLQTDVQRRDYMTTPARGQVQIVSWEEY
jgi:hypothetical protein